MQNIKMTDKHLAEQTLKGKQKGKQVNLQT